MAQAEQNHDTIKDRIVAVLKLNTTDVYTTTGEADKFHYIDTGHPHGEPDTGSRTPYCFVTNSKDNFEQITNLGSLVGSNHTALLHTSHYDISFVVRGKDARDVENKLDNFEEVILETLENDSQLVGGTSALVDQTFPVRVRPMDNTKLGKNKGGRIITLRCLKVTN